MRVKINYMSEIIALLSEIIAPVIGCLLLALGGIEVGGAVGGTAVISIEIVLFAITINMNGKK